MIGTAFLHKLLYWNVQAILVSTTVLCLPRNQQNVPHAHCHRNSQNERGLVSSRVLVHHTVPKEAVTTHLRLAQILFHIMRASSVIWSRGLFGRFALIKLLGDVLTAL